MLSRGYFPTGNVVFTLTGPNGFSYTQTDTVSGNATYTASTLLPTTGTVAGTYTWSVTYDGDANNRTVTETGSASNGEQTVVSAASPMIVTTASAAMRQGTRAATLTDTAVLSGGYFPSGNLVFMVTGPGGFSYTQTDTVSGNGTYTASTPLPTTGTVAGTYTWTAHYVGDANNIAATDQGGSAEQVTVAQTSPTLGTTASAALTLGTAAPTLSDTAVLSGGLNPSGNLVFTLTGPDGFSYTQTDTVSGNGTYTASTLLATTGTVAGTYTWSVTYEGDVNNNVAIDQGGATEQTVVSAAHPTIVTTASAALTLGTTAPTLSDTAVLSGGYFPGGSIVFTLTGPASFSYTQTDTVNGNATYTASTTLPTTGTVAGTYTWTVTYGGNANNNTANDQGGPAERTVVSPASPTIVTTASANVTLATGPPGTVTLTDSAVLSGGYFPTGNLFFTLTGPAGFVYTQTDTVSGNATYTASTVLATTGTVAGTYSWSVTYDGDANNHTVTETGSASNGEQTVVSAASPMIVTTASAAMRQGTRAATLTDTAVLSGGYFPSGNLVFMVTGPDGFSYTQTDTVSGNGTYTASTLLPTTGTVAGTYTWTAHYVGDANNNAATDQGGSAEQVIVAQTSPTLVTTASAAITLGSTVPTLSDSAVLSGGLNPSGNLVFTLTGPDGFSYTQTDTVSGNGTYTASTLLATTGTVAGTYIWSVTYEGDVNNNVAIDQGGATEQTVVSAAHPMIVTTASAAITLGATAPTLSDSAVLSGGYFPGGSIVFTLTGPASFSYTQTDTVDGNGAYTASTMLATTGMVAGTYTWSVTYEGDANNNAFTETGTATNGEQTVVSPASPTIVTTASANVTLPTGPPGTVTLTDSAVLSGGYLPGGSIVFTLTGPAGFVYTQSDTVSGNTTYTASTVLPTTGTVAGTYSWSVTYGGDANNRTVTETGSASNGEQTVVSPASPMIVTTASAAMRRGTRAATLTDTAVLSGGYFPSGNLVFMVTGPGGFSYTQTDTVSGNGTYTASTPLPTTGTVAGTYTWTAHYVGDANNNAATDQGGSAEQVIVAQTSPTLLTTASAAITLGTTAPTLSDSAVLSGGLNPSGNLVFTLTGPDGFSYTQTDTVSGNGTYTASTLLATTGTVAGTYTWSVTYEGDVNNNVAIDQGGATEQTVVSAAHPTIVTTASAAITLGATAPTLSDSAVLSGGYFPGGSIVFTLTGPASFSYTQTDTVDGNGTYAASTLLATTGMVAGTYTWSVTYEGDVNNNAANDQASAAEETVVSPAHPTIVTTASTNVTLPTGPPGTVTLTDSAVLSGGYFPGGSIVFTLTGPAGFSYTQSDTVSGNSTYTASTVLPTTGTVAGTYSWSVTYDGDANNHTVTETGSANNGEQTVVSPASPTIVTTASANVTLPTGPPGTVTLTDSAVLSAGYFPGGSIVFTLTGPAGFVYTQTDTVSGNSTYTASTVLATTGTVAGTYNWSVTYGGDANNRTVTETGSASNGEQTVVSPAMPTLTTTPDPAAAALGTTLQDLADLTGGYHPTGSITFRLYAPGVNPAVGPATYTEIVAGVNGNGPYHTTVGFASNASGIWHWVATYNGDSNNDSVPSGPLDEPVTVPPAVDVSVTKTDNKGGSSITGSVGSVTQGSTVTYSVVVHNSGPSTATNVSVSDPLPPGITSFSWSGNGHSNVFGAISDTIASLAPGASVTYTIVASISASGDATTTTADFSTLAPNDTALAQNATLNGVRADAFYLSNYSLSGSYLTTNTTLYERNDVAMSDLGVGILSNGENPAEAGAVNEITNELNLEVLRLQKTAGTSWTSVWVSSLNGGSGGVLVGTLYWSNSATPNLSTLGANSFQFKFGDFGSSLEGNLLSLNPANFDPNAQYLFFVSGPNPYGNQNGYLFWKATTATIGNLANTATASATGDTNPNNNSATVNDHVFAQTYRAGTMTQVGLSTTTALYGQSVTLHATLSAIDPGVGVPTGTVTFYRGSVGGTFLGTATVSGGLATLTLDNLPVGLRNIFAYYGGDSNYFASDTTALSSLIVQSQTTTSVSASTTTALFGQPVTLTAHVSFTAPSTSTPTGTVTFYRGSIGGIMLGTASLNASGAASITLSNLPVGLRNIYASYGGNTYFIGSNSPTPTPTSVIIRGQTSTSVSASSTTALFGQPVTLTAHVSFTAPSSSTPTGTVTFYRGSVGGIFLGTASLNASGAASIALSNLPVGLRNIFASYSGDTYFLGSNSPTPTPTSVVVNPLVNQSQASIAVALSTANSTFGQPATMTATVTQVASGAGLPTGTVTFFRGAVNGTLLKNPCLPRGVS